MGRGGEGNFSKAGDGEARDEKARFANCALGSRTATARLISRELSHWSDVEERVLSRVLQGIDPCENRRTLIGRSEPFYET